MRLYFFLKNSIEITVQNIDFYNLYLQYMENQRYIISDLSHGAKINIFRTRTYTTAS